MIDWLGPVIHEFYGSTESGAVTVVDSHEWLERPGTVGRPIKGGEVRIYDDSGKRLGPGEVGEVYTRLEFLPEFTYHQLPDKRAEIDREGFITSGDVGYLDEAGYLFLCDRKRDMVISGGVNIYPAEIEAVLINCPGVKDCAVFGIPDGEFGEQLMAIIEAAARRPAARDRRRARLPRASISPATRCPSASSSAATCRARTAARSSSAACAIPTGRMRGGRFDAHVGWVKRSADPTTRRRIVRVLGHH